MVEGGGAVRAEEVVGGASDPYSKVLLIAFMSCFGRGFGSEITFALRPCEVRETGRPCCENCQPGAVPPERSQAQLDSTARRKNYR